MRARFVRFFSQVALMVGYFSTQAVALSPPPRDPIPSDISLNLARQGVEAALATCDRRGEKVVAAVVDRNGTIKVLMVSDGATYRDLLPDVQRAAHTVLTKGMSSGEYGKTFGGDYSKMAAASASRDLYFNPGAVPIMKAGVMVGAVSVLGDNGHEYLGNEEPCAIAGRDIIEAGF